MDFIVHFEAVVPSVIVITVPLITQAKIVVVFRKHVAKCFRNVHKHFLPTQAHHFRKNERPYEHECNSKNYLMLKKYNELHSKFEIRI